MKLTHILCLVALLLPAGMPARASKGVEQMELHHGWQFKQARGANWYAATVPGVIHTDLRNNELIDDPFFRLNERGMQWIDKEDWVYRTTFNAGPELMQKENIDLCFDGLDTYADVTLNGQKILSADNMFRRWTAGVKHLLKPEGNVLEVYLHSPIKKGLPLRDALPFGYRASNDQSANGGVFDKRLSVVTRKAGYHYGWDWGPRLVTSGIWRPVYLRAWSRARIADVHYTQTDVDKRRAQIQVNVEVEAQEDTDATITIHNQTDGRMEATGKVALKKGINKLPVSFTMKNPRLWWTNGLGEQHLYQFSTTLALEGRLVDEHHQSLGIRSLKVVTRPDSDGESFYFELNGHPVFAKGANYIPCDVFPTQVTDSIYHKTILDAVNANMNMLRVWGGGIYENKIFYDLCDRYGILVWQDFMFACSMYPTEGALLENIRQEAIDNVRRLRNHTCLALWCGNNECLDAWFNWNWKRTLEKSDPAAAAVQWKQFRDLYFEVLPAVVEANQPGICYRKSSPYSDDEGTRNHTVGDMHYWEVWQGLKPLRQFQYERSRFFSEYGFQSFPEFSSIKRYAPRPNDWSVTSEVMLAHQRGGTKANERILSFLREEYGEPASFPNFVYMSQLLQADAMKMAMEAHRRDMPYCMGSLVWQHNDCWPVASWSSRDYYGRWKAQHYFTAKSFADILVSPVTTGNQLEVYIVSDRLKPTSGTLTLQVIDMRKGILHTRKWSQKVAPNTSTLVRTASIAELLQGSSPSAILIHLSFKDSSGREYTNNYFPLKQKEMDFPSARVITSITPAQGGYEVTLTSDVFARGAYLSVDGKDEFISDNYMDLLPGKEVKVMVYTSLTKEEMEKELRVVSLGG
ncbi:glycoside hydrolase family 2 protein [Bacteroides sp. OttesenSCG-928-J23]|nr:glycoside hydrolase family 2 protein [Bacteroides sp. OttesenSCG-928-J23]